VAGKVNFDESARGCGGEGERACSAATGETMEWRRSGRMRQGEPGVGEVERGCGGHGVPPGGRHRRRSTMRRAHAVASQNAGARGGGEASMQASRPA
jgi:hypothetical protein